MAHPPHYTSFKYILDMEVKEHTVDYCAQEDDDCDLIYHVGIYFIINPLMLYWRLHIFISTCKFLFLFFIQSVILSFIKGAQGEELEINMTQ